MPSGGALMSYSFDGNDYLEAANSTSLDITGTALSISLWVKLNALGCKPFGKWADNSFTYHYLIEVPGSGQVLCAINVGSTQVAQSGSAISTGVWTHLAATFDGITTRMYVNGSQVATAGGGTFVAKNTPLRIGGTGGAAVE